MAMDVTVVNPFLESAINMFEQMFGITPEHGKPFIVTPNANHRWEVSGVIGIVGSTEGILLLRVTRLFAMKLLEKSGITVTDDAERQEVMREMISEFVNIISGNALSRLGDKDIDITPPVTVQGENHSISWPVNAPIIGVPFLTKYGPFEMQINLCTKKEI